MFKVYHDMTHYEWSVDTKDELLSELDILNARAKHKQINDAIHISYEKDNDIIDSMQLELPIHDDIDNHLVGFGNDKVKSNQAKISVFNPFKRFFSRGKKKTTDTQSNEKRIDFVYDKDKSVLNTRNDEHEQTGVNEKETQITFYNEYDSVEERKEKEHVTEKHTVEFLGDTSENFDTNDTMTVEKEMSHVNNEAVIITEDSEVIPKMANQKVVYLTKDTVPISELKQDFMQRVNQEIAFIDESVATLLTKRKEHEKLLHALEHFDTLEE